MSTAEFANLCRAEGLNVKESTVDGIIDGFEGSSISVSIQDSIVNFIETHYNILRNGHRFTFGFSQNLETEMFIKVNSNLRYFIIWYIAYAMQGLDFEIELYKNFVILRFSFDRNRVYRKLQYVIRAVIPITQEDLEYNFLVPFDYVGIRNTVKKDEKCLRNAILSKKIPRDNTTLKLLEYFYTPTPYFAFVKSKIKTNWVSVYETLRYVEQFGYFDLRTERLPLVAVITEKASENLRSGKKQSINVSDLFIGSVKGECLAIIDSNAIKGVNWTFTSNGVTFEREAKEALESFCESYWSKTLTEKNVNASINFNFKLTIPLDKVVRIFSKDYFPLESFSDFYIVYSIIKSKA